MLSLEQFFRLSSLVLLSVLFISVSAIAEKKVDEEKSHSPNKTGEESIFTYVDQIQEAELINQGIYNASNLTTIGNRLEISQTKTSNQ